MKKTLYTLMVVVPMVASCAWVKEQTLFQQDQPVAAAEHVAAVPSREGITQLWKIDIDQRLLGHTYGYSTPVATDHLVIAGSQDGFARVYRLSDGREKFSIALREVCDSGAAQFSNGLIALADSAGVLYGIDPEKGTLAWQYQLSSVLVSAPIVVGDDILVQTVDNSIYRISATGEKRWSYTGQPSGLNMYLTASPMLHDNVIYSVFANGESVAIDVDSGMLKWRRQLILDPDAAVLSELRAPMATPVWLDKFVLGMQEGVDAVLVAFYQGDLMVLSAKDGSPMISLPISMKTSPVVDGHHLFVADTEGMLQSINLQDGSTLWKQKISTRELSGLTLSGQYLWLTDDEGWVTRVNLQGEPLGRLKLQGRIDRAPVALPDGVLVRSNQGLLTRLQ
ncbi:MAG: PQQ-binding-like beta-propeller repeat protein [Zetaproteobacteria bacterium]|nr:PQQ-binding-like beta-propeller repeat protein [Zetaproteobacteria bacterium]